MQTQFIPRQVAGLQFLDRDVEAGVGSILLLHGYGADMHDLAGIAPMLSAVRDFRWIFPNGPLAVPIGPHVEGRAWYPIQAEALEAAMFYHQPLRLAERDPSELLQCGDSVGRLAEKLSLSYRGRFFLGGFSQGGTVASEAVLAAGVRPHGLVLLSSTMVAQARWRGLIGQVPKMRVFISHGQQDAILPFAGSEALAKFWQDAGHDVTFVPFRGGHEIPMAVLERLNEFLGS